MKRTVLAAALLLGSLSACAAIQSAVGSGPQPTLSVQKPSASVPGWSVWATQNINANPDMLRRSGDGLAAFDFPIGAPTVVHVDYVTRAHAGPLVGHALTVTYTISGPGALAPNTLGFNSGCGAPQLHLIIAVPGYKTDGAASEDTERWFSVAAGPLTPGTHTLTVPLTPDQWVDVVGQSSPSAFAAALANIGSDGVTFGAERCADGHGVAALSDGVAFEFDALATQ